MHGVERFHEAHKACMKPLSELTPQCNKDAYMQKTLLRVSLSPPYAAISLFSSIPFPSPKRHPKDVGLESVAAHLVLQVVKGSDASSARELLRRQLGSGCNESLRFVMQKKSQTNTRS